MGASMMLAKLLGKYIGKNWKVPVKDGIMFPFRWEYADKIKDLQQTTDQVSKDFLQELAKEAYDKRDLKGLKVIYDYAKQHDYKGQVLEQIVRYGQDLKLHQFIGDPFAMIESVVNHLG